MIVYEATKGEFVDSVFSGSITDEIYEMYQQKIGKSGKSQIMSWENSMQYMYRVLEDSEIPDDCGVAIEFTIPTTSKRIDFILTGLNQFQDDSVVIIELKQWSEAQKVEGKDGVVKTILGGGLRETTHPSYQVWSYASLIKNFNQTVDEEEIGLYPCAYLHNYDFKSDDPLTDEIYEDYYSQAPLYGKRDALKLRNFIKKYIKYGDNSDILLRIENGKIRPSKKLQDTLSSMLDGNKEFIMIDEQKIAYELAIKMARESYLDDKKRVLIVEGGPGTGKSVVAINLLVDIMRDEMNSCYVTKNTAPREVFYKKLKGGRFKVGWIKNIFKGSGTFIDSQENDYDAIIVDEAHRLTEKTGFFKKGDNQIKEIINAGKFCVFFIDKYQRISIEDYGSIGEIRRFASEFDAEVKQIKLASQFRCNGSDGYLSWLNDVLEIEETANYDGFDFDYDFRVVDSASELKDLIFEKNLENNKSRLVAGYCWDWISDSKDNSDVHDIVIDDFSMSWNLGNSKTWAIDEDSINEVGCIHTSQGLEFDYIGVIIGEDMRFDGEHIVTDFNMRASTDRSIFGIKKMHKQDSDKALKLADAIIKNTYRTLMTRGMKGCYIYCEDELLHGYFKEKIR
ncbi:DNA/RNA helicase domain-containing protein [Methanobrevibacter sp.]|uniref:DNA/RNA helicase domain-containing protein n=1 Tax=Methanobrevibacter sp. TaxID=66852 RepID=UPI003890378F